MIGDRNFLGHLTYSLAIADSDEGRFADAEDHLVEAVEAFAELGNKGCAGHTIDEAARLAVERGDARRAARLLAATEAQRGRLGILGHAYARRYWVHCRERVAEALDDASLEAAWKEGRAMTFDQTVAYTLAGFGGSG
jgi:hypothetical protein